MTFFLHVIFKYPDDKLWIWPYQPALLMLYSTPALSSWAKFIETILTGKLAHTSYFKKRINAKRNIIMP